MNEEVSEINLLEDISFLSPTVKLKELSLLQHIESNNNTTQKEMAKAINAAPSMVNTYLKEYEDKGYIKRSYQSAKVVDYIITSEGIKRKNYLLITYLHELLKMYRLAQENVEKFLRELESIGCTKVLLYGAGEVAQTILSIIKSRNTGILDVIAIIDDNEQKINQKILGYKIISKSQIKDCKHDAIIITSYTFENDIVKALDEIDYPLEKVKRFFGK